ncbi:hypothetical protein EGW08_007022, partial [Elysia chlorotica]
MAITEDDNAPLLYRDSWLLGMDNREQQIYHENNEPPDVKQGRWRSIRIIYTVVFLNAICFTMLLPSLWTYLQVLDPGASTSQLGWTVAAFSLGQLIASPIFGAWANMRRSHKEPTAFSFSLAALSYSFYAYLESIPGPKNYYMIAARCMLGLSAGNVAVWRSYVASATTLKERTVTMANVNICASAGFVLGPILQAAFVPISYPGPMEKDFLHVNMYTIPGLAASVFSSISALLILIVFKEHRIKDEPGTEAAHVEFLPSQSKTSTNVPNNSSFLFYFPRLTTPLIMHNFAWNKSKATFIQGMVTGGISILAIFIYFVVKALSKRVSERALLMTGFLFTAAACFVFVPFGQELPPRGLAREIVDLPTMAPFSSTELFTTPGYVDTTPKDSRESEGCPWNLSWCAHVPVLHLAQYAVGTLLYGVGYPLCHVLTFTIFSKVLGSKPQASNFRSLMGIFAASGSLAGITGPVLISHVYDQWGPRVAFTGCTVFLLVVILYSFSVIHRLIPLSQRQKQMGPLTV